MNYVSRTLVIGGLMAGVAAWSMVDAPTATAQQFYKNKTLKMIIRSNPGGGYDFYARLLARHMPKYIPGNPKTISVNMGGAGGIVAANYMMHRAKKDGTEIAHLGRELALSQRVGDVGVKYDVNRLTKIGSASSSTYGIYIGRKNPIQTYEQLRKSKKPILFAATGPGAGSYQYPSILKNDGFKVKIITGYNDLASRVLAIEQGDIHATANSYGSMTIAIKEFGLTTLFYAGAKDAALKGVPHMNTQLSKQAQQLAALVSAPLAAGRPFFAPPGVPSDRVRILRAAFKSALADPQLLKEAKRAKRKIAWTDPEEMDKIYQTILGASDKVIDLYKSGSKKK